MKYTKVPTDTWQTIQINAGVVAKTFTPATGAVTDIFAATTGGMQFNSNPTFQDFGEDVDNVPPNTYQLKRIQYFDPTASGTFVAMSAALAKSLIGSAEYGTSGTPATEDTTHIVPTHTLDTTAFDDFWVIGDYSDKNGATNGGYVAVHIKHALNTAGFQWTSGKDAKGQFAFEYHGHYDLTNIDDVPFEIYVKAGTAEPTT